MKKVLGLTLIIGSVMILGLVVLGSQPIMPRQVHAATDEITVQVSVSAEISLSSAATVDMGSIQGVSGGVATGETTWTIITNNNTGFSMTLKADQANTLDADSESDEFIDYTEAISGTPDYSWSVANDTAEFGFTVEPETDGDTVANFRDNGSSTCNTGANQTVDKCWLGFNSTTEISVINRTSVTDYTGEDEKIKFRAELYNSDNVPDSDAGMLAEDTYTAVITATVTMN